MASSSGSKDRVQRHRDQLRAQGMRPIQIWVPDTRSEVFATQAHEQSLLTARSPHAPEDQAFLEDLSELDI